MFNKGPAEIHVNWQICMTHPSAVWSLKNVVKVSIIYAVALLLVHSLTTQSETNAHQSRAHKTHDPCIWQATIEQHIGLHNRIKGKGPCRQQTLAQKTSEIAQKVFVKTDLHRTSFFYHCAARCSVRGSLSVQGAECNEEPCSHIFATVRQPSSLWSNYDTNR